MKFSVENKKKQMAYIAIILISLAFTGWMWLGRGQKTTQVISSPDNMPVTPASGISKGVLPFGTEFKVDIFSNPKYQVLVPNQKLEISASEIGRNNPFLAPTSTASVTGR